MAADGYKDIVSIDISTICIRQQNRWPHEKSCTFMVADARHMPQFPDGSFVSIIDKGTLDSILCSATSFPDVADTLSEVCRLLQPGGRFLVITYGNPSERLKHLRKDEFDWNVETFTVEKVALHKAQARADGPGSSSLEIKGPYSHEPVLQSLELIDEVVFVYICTKERLSNGSSGTHLQQTVSR
jgi:EEF1A lysine methyltransferase 4